MMPHRCITTPTSGTNKVRPTVKSAGGWANVLSEDLATVC
jgi:hypothetical protein